MPPKKKEETPKRVYLGRPGNNVKIGIVGVPNVGKSTFFNCLSKLNIPAENFPFCTIEPNEAVVPLPDQRFNWLVKQYNAISVVPPVIAITDIAGLVKGAAEGAGLGNAFLSHIQAVDAIYHMVRAFDSPDVTHVEGNVDPVRDIEIIQQELRLKDIDRVTKLVDGMRKNVERGVGGKEKKLEYEALVRVKEWLESGKDVSFGQWSAFEVDVLNPLQLLTAKPVVFLINVSKKDYLRKSNKYLPKIAEFVKARGGEEPVIPLSCEFELEMLDLEESGELEAYQKESPTHKSILNRVLKTGYQALGLIHFFTCGKEVRSWTIRKGRLAPQAAGVIHSDMEKGFIKAEVQAFADVKELGSEEAVKKAGKLKLQGKNYERIGFGCELELVWIVPKQNGEIPVKRSGHSFTLKSTDSETSNYMFGGCDHKSPPGPTNDLFKVEINDVIPSANGPEDLPPPRWRHSAVLHDKKIVVFGGFSAEKRMNDLWIFNTELCVWEQKHPQGLWEGLPQCRGAHSATLVEDKMYVFGGYGGNGYGRTDFNDLHALDLTTFRWEEIQTEGEKPEPRSGHQTCLQFQDIFAFDLSTRTWSMLNVRLPSPTWNHTCVGVPAVPNWKVFMFGGNSGDLAESGTAQGAYLNSVMVLDTGIMEWVSPPVKGDLPTARADTTMVFDKNTNHLTFFGGWANRWFNDLHVLNASEIVGPLYAISSIEPTSGPITGNAKIKVYGYSFTGQSANLRFAVTKGFVDVVGTVLDSTVIQATAPSFEKYGSLLTEVRASLSGSMYTNVSTSFKFHSVTAASKTLAFGPCLISSLNDNCLAEFPTAFIIQSRDKDDIPRDYGGDEFTIVLKSCDEPSKPATPEAEDPPITSIIDKNDGTYVVTFAAPKAGKYQLSVEFNGTFAGIAGPVRGSPFTIFFQQPTEENEARCMPPLNSEKDMDSSDLIRRLMANMNKRNGDLIRRLMANMNKRNGEFRRILIDLRKDIPSNETDGLETLRKVKEIIRKLESEKEINHLILDQVRQLFGNIKEIGGHVDKELVEIGDMEKLFLDVQKQIPTTEQRTQEPTRIFSEKTEEKIIAYEKTITKKMETMKTLDFWSSKPDPEKGLEKIESY
ncbi:Dynein heavy chain, partial [Globisporangium splendens]